MRSCTTIEPETDEAVKTRKKKAASKTKFTCPACDLNAWAKPEAFLVCGDCAEPMDAEPVDQDDD
jgi:transcription elongation factor Elf1